MKTYPTYQDLFVASREIIVADLEMYPLEWRDDEHLWSLVSEAESKLFPEDADFITFEWGLSVLRERPDLKTRPLHAKPVSVVAAMYHAVRSQLVDDLMEEFDPVAERLMDPNFD